MPGRTGPLPAALPAGGRAMLPRRVSRRLRRSLRCGSLDQVGLAGDRPPRRVERLEAVDQNSRLAGALDHRLHAGPRQRHLAGLPAHSEPDHRSTDAPKRAREPQGVADQDAERRGVSQGIGTGAVEMDHRARFQDSRRRMHPIGMKPKPVRASPASRPCTRWPPGRSSDSTLDWPSTRLAGTASNTAQSSGRGNDRLACSAAAS